MPLTRKDTTVFLVGSYYPQILGSKLPSNSDVLKVLFFNIREVGLSVHLSAKLVIEEVLPFWAKARIPTRDSQHCIKKLVTLYEKWRDLQKHRGRPSSDVKEKSFTNSLADLFDIAHAKALDLIKIEEDKQFLLCQRKKSREGFMFGIDWDRCRKEEKSAAKKQRRLEREKKRQDPQIQFTGECV